VNTCDASPPVVIVIWTVADHGGRRTVAAGTATAQHPDERYPFAW
jgi:hypothetical protein